MESFDWLVANRSALLAITLALGCIVVAQRLLRRWRRRRAPATLHPRLARYGGVDERQLDADRARATAIIATSSTNRIAGYEILQQMEAVFVEGYRAPEDAIIGLKAAAGRVGANAVINLSHQRTASGRCTCQGDAVLVRLKREPPPTGASAV